MTYKNRYSGKVRETISQEIISELEDDIREEAISQLEDDIICDALHDFIDAMREDVNASNDEIRKSILKELNYKLGEGASFIL